MSMTEIPAQYNKKSSAVKRIMQEARELIREPSTDFAANPLETDIFEWHFTIRGPEGTDFAGGLYHGRILLPNNYPFAPPSLMFLTPNGRFELHKKVCLSITGYHPEYWQPAWGIRTVLVAVMGFLPTESKGAIGGLDTSESARQVLAKQSRTWACKICASENITILPDVDPEHQVRAQLKPEEMADFSFGYEADKNKKSATDQGATREAESMPAAQDGSTAAKIIDNSTLMLPSQPQSSSSTLRPAVGESPAPETLGAIESAISNSGAALDEAYDLSERGIVSEECTATLPSSRTATTAISLLSSSSTVSSPKGEQRKPQASEFSNSSNDGGRNSSGSSSENFNSLESGSAPRFSSAILTATVVASTSTLAVAGGEGGKEANGAAANEKTSLTSSLPPPSTTTTNSAPSSSSSSPPVLPPRQVTHVRQAIPLWFDALILGLVGIVVALVIRRVA